MSTRRVAPPALLRAAIAGLAAAAVIAGACASGEADQTKAVQVQEVSDTGLIAVAHADAFPVAPVAVRDIADHLSSTCVVTPDINRSVPVNALGGGRVVELRAKLGDQVQQGQTLVVISSPDLSTAIQTYEHAVADEALARKQLERSSLLFDHGSIARKDVEAAQDAEDKAGVDLTTTAAQVRMLGGDVDHPTPMIELKAPISGTIVQQSVSPAAGVKSPDNAPNLFTIADLSRVWVLCDIYENDLARVEEGEAANVRLNAYADREFHGRVANIATLLDSATRTAKVRVELDNPQGVMRVGMFATAEFVAASRTERLVVPVTALLRMHDADWVFVKAGAAQYRRQQVQAGPPAGDGFQEVLSGLSRRDSVVKDALQFSQAAAKE